MNEAETRAEFTDPALRGPDAYGGYLRMATERSLERIGAERFDLLLLHNPDSTGYRSPDVWDAMGELRWKVFHRAGPRSCASA